MILRPYQKKLVEAAIDALDRYGNTLAVAATGAGKTIMLADLARRLGGRQLVLQHRQELVKQNLDKFKKVNPDNDCGLWTADVKTFEHTTTFAMVQSLTKYVEQLPAFDLVIADEAHHCPAPTWRKILDKCKEVNPDVKIVGWTATPSRTDSKGLRTIFDNVCGQISTKSLISLGFLVPYKTYVVDVGGTIDALKSLQDGSDFGDQTEVEGILDRPAVNEEIVRNWKKYADGRATVVFCSTVEHAKSVAACFNRAGINAACIWGEMSTVERQAILSLMTKGKIDVVTNAMVLTEGWDYPPVSCIILLRRCSDKGPLIQMVGRGLRIASPDDYPGIQKSDCIVLDFGASLLKHQSLDADTELLDDKPNADIEIEVKEKKCPSCEVMLPNRIRICPICGYDFRDLKDEVEKEHIELTEIDLLANSCWRYEDLFGSGACLMASGFNAWSGIFSPDCGQKWFALGKQANLRKVQNLYVGDYLQALAAADDFLRTYETEGGAKKTRSWLDEQASEKQMDLLEAFGYRGTFSKYTASCHINFQLNRKKIEKILGIFG